MSLCELKTGNPDAPGEYWVKIDYSVDTMKDVCYWNGTDWFGGVWHMNKIDAPIVGWIQESENKEQLNKLPTGCFRIETSEGCKFIEGREEDREGIVKSFEEKGEKVLTSEFARDIFYSV